MRPTPPPQGVALRIQTIVQENPGIHFRELGRAATLTSTGQLRHHIDRLCRRGYLCEVGDGRYRRYFPAGHAPDLQPQIARLSRALPRRVIRLLAAGPLTRTTMRHRLGCADSTLGYHLARMLRNGDLAQQRSGNATWYALADPDCIRRVLEAQEGVANPAPQPVAYVMPALGGEPIAVPSQPLRASPPLADPMPLRSLEPVPELPLEAMGMPVQARPAPETAVPAATPAAVDPVTPVVAEVSLPEQPLPPSLPAQDPLPMPPSPAHLPLSEAFRNLVEAQVEGQAVPDYAAPSMEPLVLPARPAAKAPGETAETATAENAGPGAEG